MPLIVQKFGGTSVADSEKILAAARKAIRAQKEGNQVVMVVSAMGKNTDALVDLAGQINERPPAREMDMLLSTGEQVSVALMAMAIDSLGHKGVSLTGGQIGIRTDSTHTKARIQSISTERMRRHLESGHIVIAAGFQGIDEDLNITTLGRGGSDTTAVALAAVLGADSCEIHTDVDGVYTTDPRVAPEARRVSYISYDEMLELASLGAGVMHSRSIEFAKKFSVPIHVRSSFTDIPGSMILADAGGSDRPVSGAALTRDEARIALSGVPDVPGTSFEIFSRIAAKNATVDMIVQNIGDGRTTDLSFTVPRSELLATLDAVQEAQQSLGDFSVSHDDQVSKVSVVGLGMAHQPGVAHRMFRTLADADINLQMITTSEIKISVLVERGRALDALRAVHSSFELDKEPKSTVRSTTTTATAVRSNASGDALDSGHALDSGDALDVVERLQYMEELMIDEVVLDDSQGRITVHGLPDQPGLAAKVFGQIGAAGVFVDMIVQSFGRHGEADLSFTVPTEQVEQSVKVAEQLAEEFNCQKVTSSVQVAKLSVSGIGLRSHTGVAIGMFRSMSEAGINVAMINTSEVRVNIVVADTQGEAALAKLQEAFGDVLR